MVGLNGRQTLVPPIQTPPVLQPMMNIPANAPLSPDIEDRRNATPVQNYIGGLIQSGQNSLRNVDWGATMQNLKRMVQP